MKIINYANVGPVCVNKNINNYSPIQHFVVDNTLLCGWRFGRTKHISEETFLQDFLVILKQMLQNY